MQPQVRTEISYFPVVQLHWMQYPWLNLLKVFFNRLNLTSQVCAGGLEAGDSTEALDLTEMPL